MNSPEIVSAVDPPPERVAQAERRRPRLGFVGVGWIGMNRLQAIAGSQTAEIVGILDLDRNLAARAAQVNPGASVAGSLDELLGAGLDGIVIATPNALHADQAIAALEAGVAVFCQKPLGRNADEACRIIDAARNANRLLGVDLSYRHSTGMIKIRELIQRDVLGRVYAAELVFHNAYGPDKPWFYERELAGGGCVIDLGTHLVDLTLWALNYPLVENVSSRLLSQGEPASLQSDRVEDYCVARIDFADGGVAQITCSWKQHMGCDAVISAAFYGTRGGAALRNVNGSFYDLNAEKYSGTGRELLSSPPDAWGGRAALAWVDRLAAGAGFDPEVEHVCEVAAVLDAIYQG